MYISAIAVSVLYTVVNFLLLICTGGLLKRRIRLWQCIVGSITGGSYVAVCLLLADSKLNNWSIYLLVILAVSVISFGFSKGWIASAAVYVMLTMSLGGVNIGTRGVFSLLVGTVGIFLILFISKFMSNKEFVSVEIIHMDKRIKFNALIDSGNLLTDPITGSAVLIVDAQVAQQLTGLSSSQLRKPVESINMIEGLRLIPYSTISERGKFLLAKKVDDVRIGSWRGSILIAFCPEILSSNGRYQGLVGGQV